MDTYLINLESGQSQNILFCYTDDVSIGEINAIITGIERSVVCENLTVLGELIILN
jgi:hypothetical protein